MYYMPDLFSRIAKYYDRIIPSFDINQIEHHLNLTDDDIIVDLGGGTGRVSISLLERTRECIVIDASLQMLQQAQIKDKNLHIIVARSSALPLRSNAIDKFFVNDTMHHIKREEHSKSLEEIHEALKKDGVLFIREYDRNYFWNKFLILFEKILRFKSTFYTPAELKSLCNRSNFNTDVKLLTKATYLIIAKK